MECKQFFVCWACTHRHTFCCFVSLFGRAFACLFCEDANPARNAWHKLKAKRWIVCHFGFFFFFFFCFERNQIALIFTMITTIFDSIIFFLTLAHSSVLFQLVESKWCTNAIANIPLIENKLWSKSIFNQSDFVKWQNVQSHRWRRECDYVIFQDAIVSRHM